MLPWCLVCGSVLLVGAGGGGDEGAGVAVGEGVGGRAEVKVAERPRAAIPTAEDTAEEPRADSTLRRSM